MCLEGRRSPNLALIESRISYLETKLTETLFLGQLVQAWQVPQLLGLHA